MTAPIHTALHAEQTWHISEQAQQQQLVILALVFVAMLIGMWALAVRIPRGWNVDDFEADYFTGRDMHLNDIRDAMRDARVSSR